MSLRCSSAFTARQKPVPGAGNLKFPKLEVLRRLAARLLEVLREVWCKGPNFCVCRWLRCRQENLVAANIKEKLKALHTSHAVAAAANS